MFASKFFSIKTNQTKPFFPSFLCLSCSLLYSKMFFFLCPAIPSYRHETAEEEIWRPVPVESFPALPYLGFIQPKEHVQKNSHYMNLGEVSPTLVTRNRSVQILTHYSETPPLHPLGACPSASWASATLII